MNDKARRSEPAPNDAVLSPGLRAKRSAPPLVTHAAVFLLGCGVVAGALASPIIGQADEIEDQKSTIALNDTQLSDIKRDLKDQQSAFAQCSYAADLFKQAAEEYYAAGQSTADGIANIFGDYSAQLAATGQHASAAKTAYDTAVSLDCDSSGITVSR